MSGEQAHPPQASAEKSDRSQLFISYSHRDADFLDSDFVTREELPPPIPAPWPESSEASLPERAGRSRFGPLETATLGRVGSSWEIQRHSIESWGFRERLGVSGDIEN